MPNVCICQFRCVAVTHHEYNTETVKLAANYDQSIVDQSFSNATPSGGMEFTVTNEKVHGQFKPGKKYLITIAEAE